MGAEADAKAKEDAPMAEEGAEKEEKAEEAPMEVDEEPEVQVDFDGLDVFAVDDVCNLGGGMPLFKEFLFEDWTLMSLRYELYLLVQAFRKDCGDPERAGIHIDHLAFYYNKYYKKALSAKYFGVETFTDVIALVKDSIYITKQQVLD